LAKPKVGSTGIADTPRNKQDGDGDGDE
jgi:hypothetical protein